MERVDEKKGKAKSKTQQRLFGLALSIKRGDTDMDDLDVDDETRESLESLLELSEEKLEEYASTKHDDLPEKVKEAVATPSNTVGMGNISMPQDGKAGSGDVPSPAGNGVGNETPSSRIYSFDEFTNRRKNKEQFDHGE